MSELVLYVLQLCIVSSLLALALSVYMDGLGYLSLHIACLSGVGSYAFSILASRYGWPTFLALVAGVILAALLGLLAAEATHALRGDGLTLATFGIGVAGFEVFRYSDITGGVFGLGSIPRLVGTHWGIPGQLLASLLTLLLPLAAVAHWRASLGGRVVISLRMDEWAGVSIGAPLRSHQRVSGLFSGSLAGLAGVVLASSIRFVEPRDFMVASLLVPLGAVIVANGRTPHGVVLVAGLIVAASQGARFLTDRPTLAGPLTEITIAVGLAGTLVALRLTGKPGEPSDG